MVGLAELKNGLEEVWESVTEGWRNLRQHASSALTRFRKTQDSSVPTHADTGGAATVGSPNWGLLAGELFEDSKRVVVRLEIPGLERGDFDLEVRDDMLIVRGEKRFRRESDTGRYRVLECAYGSFHRAVPLPAKVDIDRVTARYSNGILKVELPKSEIPQRRSVEVKVN